MCTDFFEEPMSLEKMMPDKLYIWILALLLWSTGSFAADDFYPTVLEPEEPSAKLTDIWSIGIVLGPSVYLGDTVDFANEGLNDPVIVQDVDEQLPGLAVQLSLRYGLDNYLVPGISLACKLSYSYTNIDDVQLDAFEGGIQVFEFDDKLLRVHTFSLIPTLELRLFALTEYLFEVDLPPSWEIYLQGGVKLNYNYYNEQENDAVELENFDAFTLGMEISAGVEIYIAEQWALRAELEFSTNSSEFDVEQAGIVLFSADLELYELRSLVGIEYYF